MTNQASAASRRTTGAPSRPGEPTAASRGSGSGSRGTRGPLEGKRHSGLGLVFEPDPSHYDLGRLLETPPSAWPGYVSAELHERAAAAVRPMPGLTLERKAATIAELVLGLVILLKEAKTP